MDQSRAVVAVLESMPVGFFAMDRDFRFTYLNDRAAGLLGHRPHRGRETLLGRRIWDEIPDLRETWFHGFSAWVHIARVPIQLEEYWQPLGARVEAHIHPAQGGVSVFFRALKEGCRETPIAVREAQSNPLAEVGHRVGTPGRACQGEGDGDATTWEPEIERGPGVGVEEGGRDELLNALRPVAHELRTPLHAILLSAERLLESGTGEETGAEKHLRNIIRAAQHASRLTSDLHDAARLGQGNLPLEREYHAPDSIVREAAELSRPLVEKEGIRLETDAPGELPPVVADQKRVLQVFSNLIENAARHTEKGGRIVVRAAAAPNSSEPRHVRFLVEDTGTGIQLEAIPDLFDELAESARRKSERPGLGLSISQAIVKAHGGELWVERSEPDGSTLAFTLPAAEDPGSSADGGAMAGTGGA